MRELWRRLRHGRQRERGLDEEIRFHIDQQTEKNRRAGMTADEARRQAFVRFGGVEYLKERTRDEYRPALLEDFLRDVRYGVRLLFRTKAFAIVAILTLGLGIGAATAVFSVVDGVLLRPLPYPDPDRIVRLHQVDGNGRRNSTVSEPNFEDWKSGTRSFSAMAEMSGGQTPVTIGGEATMTPGATVSREFFDVMGVRPLVGRGFLPEEQRVGGAPAAIISDRLWRTRLGARRSTRSRCASSRRCTPSSASCRRASTTLAAAISGWPASVTRRRGHGPLTTSRSSRGCRAASPSAQPTARSASSRGR